MRDLAPCWFALVLVPFTAVTAQSPAERTTIDHVILASPDLGRDTIRLRTLTGVDPEWGGQHPGRGTQNALLSLGPPTYLEVVAPLVPGDSVMRAMGIDPGESLSPYGWAAGTTDLDATVRRLRQAGFEVADPRPGERRRPDGTTLRWRTAPILAPMEPGTPFLIEWEPGAPHPSVTAPRGCRLGQLTILTREVATMQRLFALLDLPVLIRSSETPGLGILLDCPTGSVQFPLKVEVSH